MNGFGRTIILAFILMNMVVLQVQAGEGVIVLGEDESLTMGISGAGPLTDERIQEWLADPANHALLDVTLPLGMSLGQSQMKGLDKNPLTRAKIQM